MKFRGTIKFRHKVLSKISSLWALIALASLLLLGQSLSINCTRIDSIPSAQKPQRIPSLSISRYAETDAGQDLDEQQAASGATVSLGPDGTKNEPDDGRVEVLKLIDESNSLGKLRNEYLLYLHSKLLCSPIDNCWSATSI